MTNKLEQEMALLNIPAEFVESNFSMNPETDDLIFGEVLKDGMVVLLEDTLMRASPARKRRLEEGTAKGEGLGWYEQDERRLNETSRWCRIERLRLMSGNSEMVTFVGVYSDGTKRIRTYNKSYGWFVKVTS